MKQLDCVERTGTGFRVTLKRPYRAVYGFGEKFDSCNQKGNLVRACVRERCFYQGDYTYLSMPFFLTPDGFGLYVETYVEVDFDLRQDGVISVEFPVGSKGEQAKVWLLEGTPKEIITQFRSLAGMPRVFPKWVLGAWMSSNRWHTQQEVEEQLELTKKHNFPHSVLVIEPWSDHATYYCWSGSTCKPKKGGEIISVKDIDTSASEFWQDPKKLVDDIHAAGLKLLLWTVPSHAQGENIMSSFNKAQRLAYNDYVREQGEVVKNADGSAYEIPHTWCIGDMVPDFTNPVATEHWFNHYQHLKELGIDGFKTDGGEFIHDHTVTFSDGTTGLEGQNQFSVNYSKAYAKFVGEEGIVFSRAGGQETPCFSVVWAGDQESTWSEYRSILKAGLTASMSGVNCWGFDIGGFAGYLPTKELYCRAIETAAFVPVMQWHSEAVRNGRCDFAGAWHINDRSPWNMADFHKDPAMLPRLRESFYLHYNLVPYQYALMLESGKTGIPLMRHLVLEFPADEKVYGIEDEFMLGDAILVAPVLEDYVNTRSVYLPAGKWYDLFTGKCHTGGVHTFELGRTPVLMRENKCVPLNLKGGKLCSDVGSAMDGYTELTFLVSGLGNYHFSDDLGNEISIEWDAKGHREVKNKKGTAYRVLHIESDCVRPD
ncbi:MAG: glycosyl hydrolase [Clostridia bacterium]|nr:glycosyl hydrolase [Clostridia bacterium]